MRRVLAAVALATALSIALAACTDDVDSPPSGPAADDAGRCDPALDAALAAWARAGFSGSVAVSTGGRFDCLAGYGTADATSGALNTADTVFSIGSVTKAFTAATVVDLAAAGRLKLDDRAGTLLPELTGPVADVTVRQLLLHTSGLVGSHGSDGEPLTREAAVAAIGRLRLAFAPGTAYLYSNAGYTLLALIVEKVSGTTYRTHTAARTLRLPGGRQVGGFWNGSPAAPGPRAVGYLDDGRTGRPGSFPGPHWALDGNGDLAMTPKELAEWTHALFTGRLLADGVADVLRTPGFDHGGGRAETPGWVAAGASVLGRPFLGSAGGGGDVGHNVAVLWAPERQRVAVFASNRPDLSAEKLLQSVGRALLAGEPLPAPAVPSGEPSGGPDPAAIVGRYRLDSGGSFDVRQRDNRLTVAASGRDAVAALLPVHGVPAEEVVAHERRVTALLAGRTREGREERAAIESAVGPISAVALAGTIRRDGELRTYVTVTSGGRPVTGWYAVNGSGGIEAAELPTQPPALTLVPSGGARYRPDDPTGTGPRVTVELGDGRMTIVAAGGTTVARRSG